MLGATLYSRANQSTLGQRIRSAGSRGVTSTVVCLEDAIADRDLDSALENMVAEFSLLAAATEALPLIFVRARNPAHLDTVVDRLGALAAVVNGYVAPKFSAADAEAWFAALDRATEQSGRAGVPHARAWSRRRCSTSRPVATSCRPSPARSTSAATRCWPCAPAWPTCAACSACAAARSRPCTASRPCATASPTSSTCSAAPTGATWCRAGVWEYFQRDERLFRPELRQSMFDDDGTLRDQLMDRHFDGLMSEVEADLANGLLGKSVVHPMHVAVVNALHTVPHEEWIDAESVLEEEGGGATASRFRNKMNEAGPHRLWAERIVRRGRAFGVLHQGVSVVRLLEVAQVA